MKRAYRKGRRNVFLENREDIIKRNKENSPNLGKHYNEERRRKISIAQTGEKGNNWKGGKVKEYERIRNNVDWKLWREIVFENDDYTCQACGRRGGEIHPHHIMPFKTNEGLRYDPMNGMTLCKECHMQER